MLKVKRTIYAPQIKETTQSSQLKIDLKNSIKNKRRIFESSTRKPKIKSNNRKF